MLTRLLFSGAFSSGTWQGKAHLSTSRVLLSARAQRRPSTAELFIKKKETKRAKERASKTVSSAAAVKKPKNDLLDSRDIARASASVKPKKKKILEDDLDNEDENRAPVQKKSLNSAENAEFKPKMPRWQRIQQRKKILVAFRENDPAVVWELFPTAKKDLWTFDQMIAVMAKNGFVNKAFKMYQAMKKAAVQPGAGTLLWLLIACSKAPVDTGGNYIPRCYYILDEMVKFGISPTIQHFNFVLQTCANAKDGARAEDVLGIMEQQNVRPDVNSYTSMMKVYGNSIAKILQYWQRLKSECKPDIRAYNTFLTTLKDSPNPMLCVKALKELRESGITPDKHSLSIVFDVLIKEKQLREAGAMLDDLLNEQKEKTYFDTHLCNRLIAIACRLKSPPRLQRILDLMKSKAIPYDEDTYEALIAGYGRLGRLEDSFKFFYLLKELYPRSISIRTFTNLLLACRETKNTSKLDDIEREMKRDRIQPDRLFTKLRDELLAQSSPKLQE